MEYSTLEKKNCIVVAFKGNLTGGPTSAEFQAMVKEQIEKGHTNLIGDLSEVDFMNSSGLGVLISSLISLRKADGDLKLCSATDRIKSLLRVSKLFTVFDMYETLDEAVAAYQE